MPVLPDALYEIFLLWSINDKGQIALRKVSTSLASARRGLEQCRQEADVIRAWTERATTNHLYGHEDVSCAFRMLRAVDKVVKTENGAKVKREKPRKGKR